MQGKVDKQLISIRDLTEADIPRILDYWYRSPFGYIEAMGADPSKMPTEAEMNRSFLEKIATNGKFSVSKINALIVLYRQTPIGVHSVNPLFEGDFGIFHAHIWSRDHRGLGIGFHSYPLACRIFLERFNLKKIVFKTPLQNTGAIQVKEKLGIRLIGEELIEFNVIKSNTLAKVYELSLEDAKLKWPELWKQNPLT